MDQKTAKLIIKNLDAADVAFDRHSAAVAKRAQAHHGTKAHETADKAVDKSRLSHEMAIDTIRGLILDSTTRSSA